MRKILFAIVCFSFVITCPAATITVKPDGTGDQPTIQAAIVDANNGDEVVLEPGTYTGPGNRDIDFLGKPITVRSTNPNNPAIVAATIINCNIPVYSFAFIFISDEGRDSILDGLTITGNWSFGIHCDRSGPTIRNCIITANEVGIFCYVYSNPKISNCRIINNTDHGRYGAGIYLGDSCQVEITGCEISGNSSAQGVGGIYTEFRNHIVITDSVITGNSGEYCGGIGRRPWSFPGTTIEMTNCVVTGNTGIGIRAHNLTASNCKINNNTGGGIYVKDQLSLDNCEIMGNTGKRGAGICEFFGPVTITNCKIVGNSSVFGGGGIRASSHDYPVIIDNCIIAGNTAGGSGGAIDAHGHESEFDITNCTIIGNRADGDGGAIYARGYESEFDITNCSIAGNRAGGDGGAIYAGGYESEFEITNCTIPDNRASGDGGAIRFEGHDMTIENCILWDNYAQAGREISLGSDGTLSAGYNNLQMLEDYIQTAPSRFTLGSGNFSSAPRFVTEGYWDPNGTSSTSDDFWVDGDYHLRPDSPCINAGDPDYIPEPDETDLDGNPRIIDGRIDMGAYEYNPPVEVDMQLTPQKLNCKSKGNWVKAHITLPEELTAEDIDVNTPAVLEPGGLESEYIDVLGSNNGPVHVKIGFDRQAFCASLDENGLIEIEVCGRLVTGRYFYATNTIKVSNCN